MLIIRFSLERFYLIKKTRYSSVAGFLFCIFPFLSADADPLRDDPVATGKRDPRPVQEVP